MSSLGVDTQTGYYSFKIRLGQPAEEESFEPLKPGRYDIFPGELDIQTCTPLKERERNLLDLFDSTLKMISQDPAELLEATQQPKSVNIQEEVEEEDDAEAEVAESADLEKIKGIRQNMQVQLIDANTKIEELWNRCVPEMNERPSLGQGMTERKTRFQRDCAQYLQDLDIHH